MFFVFKIRKRGFITYFHLFNYYIALDLALLYQIYITVDVQALWSHI